MTSVIEINIKYRMHYFFDDINIKNLDSNKIKKDEKSYKNIVIKYMGHVTPNIVKSLHLIINKIKGYIEESNGNKYLAPVPIDESKEHQKSMKNYGVKSEILLDQ